MSVHQHIVRQWAQLLVRQLCQVLRVDPSAYYAWRRQQGRPVAEPRWQAAVRPLAGLTEARLEISHHIAYYNAERCHSALGYHSPNHLETHLQTMSCPKID